MSVWQRVFFFVLIVNSTIPWGYAEVTESGGPLLPEQAAYDVTFYDLNLKFDLNNRSISGFLTVEAMVIDLLEVFVLDLNSHFTVDSVLSVSDDQTKQPLSFDHRQEGAHAHEGRIWIDLPGTVQAGEKLVIRVYYRGIPKFNWWSNYWVNVSCEREGGDQWWPCKDHPSDEPDSVALHFTVPWPLICVSNGKQVGVTENMDGTRTYDWFVSMPINNYNVTFYIAGYQTIEYDYQSVSGDTIPVTIWVLPSSYGKAVSHAPQFLDHLRFLEEICGPYPFRADKYGVAQTQSGGMEHQTIIAYGFGFKDGSDGFDWLHFHELAHEWWGNMVTARDWSDAWIHEGFACYMEALYAERLGGKEKYHEYIQDRSYWSNTAPVAPRESVTMWEAFSTGAIYYKGAWMLHTLRYYLGDETFFQLLRRWAYPDPSLESVTDGGQCRLATTDDFIQIAEDVTGMELSWFFEVYLRQVSLPALIGTVENDTLSLSWEIENNIPFGLPVEVMIEDSIFSVNMTGGAGKIEVPADAYVKIDPDCWILMEPTTVEGLGGWVTQQSGTRNNLYSVDFPTPDVGIAVGSYGTIVATTDGGESWNSRISGTSEHLYSVYFTDSNTGWAVGYNGIIIKTTDGGAHWSLQNSETSQRLYSTYFVDANIGWAVGYYGAVLKTTDGGMIWHSQVSTTYRTLLSVCFVNADRGWAVGEYGTILKTVNGGTRWYAQTSGTSDQLRSVHFMNADVGWAVGDNGVILKTTNGGNIWASLDTETSEDFRSIHFTDADNGWIVGEGGIMLRSTDGGATWNPQTNSISYDLNCIDFTDDGIGWVVGQTGTIQHVSSDIVHGNAQDSGGPVLTEQAAYDVTFYDLNLKIDTDSRSISGALTVEAMVLESLEFFVLDLNNHLTVDSVLSVSDDQNTQALSFDHRQEGMGEDGGRIWAVLPGIMQAGEKLIIRVYYRGMPNFSWRQTQEGHDWVGVSCELEGADLWWPCKDHPSDEPDSMALHFTVPEPLICVSNGKQTGVTNNSDNTKTYHWFVSTPINNYNVTFYLAPYRTIEYSYESVTGETIPATVWVLPESYGTAVSHTPQFMNHLRFLEERCGPYPFRADKYGVAQSPYFGMEHQTIIAYGYGFRNGPNGFDWLHLHELAHEWWGNMVTAKDWSDAWIHEGFATYMEALYAGHLGGMEAYHRYMDGMHPSGNVNPIAPRVPMTARSMFNDNISHTAAWVIHTLRYYLGDPGFFHLLRRWAYPDPSLESVTSGGQCRFATTDDFLQIAEDVTGMELDWFFEVYLRQASLPVLRGAVENDTLSLTWEIENNISFHLPVEVVINGSVIPVDMTGGTGEIRVSVGADVKIDPDCWILMEPAIIEGPGGWTAQQSGTRNHLYSIDFPAPNVGFAVGAYGTIVTSTDGGDIWNAITTDISEHLFSVDFVGINTGWIVGSRGTILKSTNGGTQWTKQTSGTYNLLLSADFIDVNTGWVVGSSGTILKTTDGGTSWQAQNGATSSTLWSVRFVDAGTGWAVGDDGTVLKTFNGGTIWYAQNSGISERLRSVDFVDAAFGCAAGNDGTILKTKNGGDAWLPINVATDKELCSVHFTDADTGWVVGDDGTILYTMDGGATWLSQTSGTSDHLYSVYATSTNTVRAVGENGTLLLRQMNRLDKTSPPDNGTSDRFALFQNYPNPFNTSTTIRFDMPESGHVILRIYNLIGQEVETLLNEERMAGRYDVEWDASDFSSGVYIYRLEIGKHVETRKLIFQR